MRDGKLILARGYGWADVEGKVPVQPDSLFRLASVSKVFTATGIMKLVEEGKLSLDRPALDILDQLKPAKGQTVTRGFAKVTVRQLLWHAGGWDRSKVPGGYDPMFQNAQVTKALGVRSPATCTDIIRWMMSRPLDSDPGQKYAYSNFGYCILGRIIEKVSGLPYETYMRQKILAPLGIRRMSIGASLLAGRKPGEVKYYDNPGAGLATSVFPKVKGRVPAPYGAWDLRTLDSHGGWIGWAIDVVRLLRGLDFDLPGTPFLRKATVLQMIARPAAPIAAPGADAFYGFGMQVRPGEGDGNWWHSGSLPGTATYFVRDGRDRMSWAILINFRDPKSAMFRDLDQLGWNAVAKVKSFPEEDLFPRYESGNSGSGITRK
jgi:N-acyl-D-amino-acid deacylase